MTWRTKSHLVTWWRSKRQTLVVVWWLWSKGCEGLLCSSHGRLTKSNFNWIMKRFLVIHRLHSSAHIVVVALFTSRLAIHRFFQGFKNLENSSLFYIVLMNFSMPNEILNQSVRVSLVTLNKSHKNILGLYGPFNRLWWR